MEQTHYPAPTDSAAELKRLYDQNGLLSPSLEPLLPTGPLAGFLNNSHSLNQGVLDIACGPGGWAHEIAHRCPDIRVMGFDISENMIAFAQNRAKKEHLKNARFRVFDLREISEIEDGPFDFIHCRLVLWFLSREEAVQLCRGIVKLLTPTGIVRLVEGFELATNSNALKQWTQALMETMAKKKGTSSNANSLHNSFLLGTFLQEAGFEHRWETAHIVHYSYGSSQHSHYLLDAEKLMLTMHAEIEEHALPNDALARLEEQVMRDVRSPEFFAQQTYSSYWASQFPL